MGVAKTNKGKLMLLWKCAVCHNKKSRIIKEQGASGFFSSLGIQTLLKELRNYISWIIRV